MASRLRLETFGESVKHPAEPDDPLREDEMRSSAYEQGYRAGWDDAIAAQESDGRLLREDLARALSDLSFTYHEAHAHVLGAIRPLLLDMVRKVLPAIAHESLAPMLVEQIFPAARTLAATPVEVAVAPASRARVEEALGKELPMPVVLTEDNTLSENQAFFRFPGSESRIDLDGVVEAISGAVAAFFDADPKEERARA